MFEVRNGHYTVMARFDKFEKAVSRAQTYHKATREPSGNNVIRYTVYEVIAPGQEELRYTVEIG